MRLRIILTTVVLPACFSIYGQDKQNGVEKKENKDIEAGFEGMIGLSYGSKSFGINVGGPSLKYKVNKKLKIGVGALPSLFIYEDKAQPRLAVSPILEYSRWMILMPYYGYDSTDKAIFTFGIGYKFI